MQKNIYLAGVGGQGLQVVGKTIVEAAYKAGYNVTYSPKYGFEKRGGLTSCFLVISDKEVGNPRAKKQDILLVMEPKAYAQFHNDVKSGGTLVVNSTLISAQDVPPEGIRRIDVPIHDICVELGNTKVISSVALGVMATLMQDLFPNKDSLLNFMLEKLNKESLNEINTRAFVAGYENAVKLLG